ncbi:uncharacterized protein LOC127131973 [Lathyrus oleraceus]|uniref:uncharacterized protein LOC127131973 n=1 Tax=Pisum sativum TaxID=3888 RepID=UPI0021D320BF|nr:uncharacterized protein LOC127131973 [Pisum sativum]
MVEMDSGRKLLTSVDKLKTPFIKIKNVLMKSNLFPVYSTTSEQCMIKLQQCGILKSTIQKLMDQGILLIDHPSMIEEVYTLEIPYDEVLPLQIPYNLSQMTLSVTPITPMMITVPTKFPFNDTKAVSWVYDPAVYIHGQKMQEKHMTFDEPIVSIVGTGGVTRNGRIFALTSSPVDNSGPSVQNKGKQIENAQQRQESIHANEVGEFLRIIRRSDYRVVQQLNQTPSKISMLSLLMCSEAHRDALVKVLKYTHMLQEIPICQFEGVVNNIATSLSLGFSDEELPFEGRNYNKALHISIECVNTMYSRVLVDTSLSLNVMPKSFLSKLTIEGLVIKLSELVVREFDGSRRTVIDEVYILIKIGPHTFFITFFVMYIYSAYNCLLGRPGIHSVGAVTSTLHQRLKFLVSNKLVVVEGEEDIMVSHMASFRYVEGEGEVKEIPF